MSLVKFIKAQLGMSSTPANNFTLDASAQDGTMKLSRGNAGATTQDVLVVDGAGKVTFPSGSEMFGVGQTWQDVTPSRSVGTTYINTTGKPIQVSIYGIMGGATADALLEIGGRGMCRFASGAWPVNSYLTLMGIVPPGEAYRVIAISGNFTSSAWLELR